VSEELVNPYAAPSHDRLELASTDQEAFYVVSAAKFAVLYLITFGLYSVYWNYKHWAMIKRARNGDEWPVARAIFSIFFQHSLTAEIEQRLRRQKIAFDWNPNARATAIVIVTLAMSLLDRLDRIGFDEPIYSVLTIACVPILAILRLQVQRAANAACNDANGRSNANFTAANIIWCVLGVLLWALILIGNFMPADL
jgi:hypothetical protein